MKIGKFNIETFYDLQCNYCGNYRSSIGFITSLSNKPTVKTLEKEGWKVITRNLLDGTKVNIQLCPNCCDKEISTAELNDMFSSEIHY